MPSGYFSIRAPAHCERASYQATVLLFETEHSFEITILRQDHN
jgi:hypothetical protein